VERLGSARTIKVDVRVIAATNKKPRGRDRQGALPRGSVLPPRGDSNLCAAAARAAGGHSAARAPLHGLLQPREQRAAQARHAGRDGGAAALRVERQHSRAAQHRRALIIMTGGDTIDLPDLPDGVRSPSRAQAAGLLRRSLAAERTRGRRARCASSRRTPSAHFSSASCARTAGHFQDRRVIGTPRSNLYKKLEQYQISQETDG